MGTLQKQEQIRSILNTLNWSYRQLADVLYEELYCDVYQNLEDTNQEDISLFHEALKKQLTRKTTSEKRLDKYLTIISEHPDFLAAHLDVIAPKYLKHQCLNESLADELKNISRWLDKDSS
ncbi:MULTISPECIES: hypothetical protein [Vibrio]|uniref:hypothetical protein n=1 Tax=Vibrio TaxID=662 RepID=UPI0006329507|nr:MULTISPECIES: hypothetical protein [Vibrio]TCT56914.1 hypothetical protein EDB42_101691 [Vibrio crassostreae]TCT69279.1 hypothetical protein EDB31_10963 [Vibrio crassostreae]TCT80643.1 hypothetical protein EDB41_101128 [Vibrio crassostreae]TCT99262.1 hypothetical protein EDB38_101128 [Vibrio crassostreae]CAK1819838.1 Elongation factor Ts [Vibrio crassostreae]